MSNCQVIGSSSLKLAGTINTSPSKSQTLRAILFASLATGKSIISNILLSPDATAMITACRMFGANINFLDTTTLEIIGTSGNLTAPDDVIHAGNSGIVLRFIAGIASLINNYTVITGDYSIRYSRPLQPIIDGLTGLGVDVKTMRGDNFAPIIIKGPPLFNETVLEGYDSQPVSGLIIAATLMPGLTTINVKNPGEKPWIDLTLDWLDRLGILYQREEYNKFIISGENNIPAFNYKVPSDLSSIAFPVAAALITNSSIIIDNVDLSDPQGDKRLLDIFQEMGANLEYRVSQQRLVVHEHTGLQSVTVDINDCIDSINILSVVACYAKGKTVINGARVARNKECDRIACITQELSKMGANITELEDGLIIVGGQLHGSDILQTYHDHRMVMALFIAALAANGHSIIHDTRSVSKSYPLFFSDMKLLGCNFSL
jgi:3-phosphoshikimate 1-carboxyvinyltransferase